MQPCNPDPFDVFDLLDMLCALPVYPVERWRKLLEQRDQPRRIAAEICLDLANEYHRLRTESQDTTGRKKAQDLLAAANEKNRVLTQTLERERQTHTAQVAEWEKAIHDLKDLVAVQQQKINQKEAVRENQP